MLVIYLFIVIPFVKSDGVFLEPESDREDDNNSQIHHIPSSNDFKSKPDSPGTPEFSDDDKQKEGYFEDNDQVTEGDSKFIKDIKSKRKIQWHDLMYDINVSERYVSRCSRRYNPGICPDPNIVVWTFVFHLQNCTERLGCYYSSHSNRFRNHKYCMRRCRPLVDIYTHILAYETNMACSSNGSATENAQECREKMKAIEERGISGRRVMDEDALSEIKEKIDEDEGDPDEPYIRLLRDDRVEREPSELDPIIGENIDRYALRFKQVNRNETDDFPDIFKK